MSQPIGRAWNRCHGFQGCSVARRGERHLLDVRVDADDVGVGVVDAVVLVPPEPRARAEHVGTVRQRPVPSTRRAERAVVGVVHHPGADRHQADGEHRGQRQRQHQAAGEERQSDAAASRRHGDPSGLPPKPPPGPLQLVGTRLARGDLGHADRHRCVGEPRQLLRAVLAESEPSVGETRLEHRTTPPAALGRRTLFPTLRPEIDPLSAVAHRRLGTRRAARPNPQSAHTVRVDTRCPNSRAGS